MTRILDSRQVGETSTTRDGYLTARVRAARVGIQDYRGEELNHDDKDSIFRVYRPEEEVFSKDSLGSYIGKPITVDHPDERVTADNYKKHARGHISGVARDGDSVVLEVAIMDKKTVDMVTSGAQTGLSAGYVTQLDWTPGVTPDGEKYDVVQRGIFVDHLAIVQNGRAGEEYRIGDSVPAEGWGARPLEASDEPSKEDQMSNALITTVQVGDGAVQTTEAGAIHIRSLTANLNDTQSKLSASEDRIETLEKSIETKDGEIAVLKKSLSDATSPQAISDMAKKRAKMVEKGKKADLDEEDMEKMSDSEIARKIVSKHLGDDWVKANDGADMIVVADSITLVSPNRGDTKLADGIKVQDSDPWAFLHDEKKGTK